MLQQSIKLIPAKFEYFILQLSKSAKPLDIKAKLQGFKKFDEKNSPIVISLDNSITEELAGKIVLAIVDIAEELKIKIHAILANDVITSSNIYGIQVVDIEVNNELEMSSHKSLILEEPVRSGIKVENAGDIIITKFVSDNAEIIAGGNIHIYGEGRGRLIAGNNGDKGARIFVTNFNAELISIGGLYRVIEEKLPNNIMHKSVMIYLDNKNRIIIEPLV
jgi:septum site-determining protein MinC